MMQGLGLERAGRCLALTVIWLIPTPRMKHNRLDLVAKPVYWPYSSALSIVIDRFGLHLLELPVLPFSSTRLA